MTQHSKKILVAGYYGFGNIGDEAILSAIIQDLGLEIPSVSFTVVSGNPQGTKTSHGVDAVAWSNLQGIIDKMNLSDLVILGGGGLFHDYWGFDPSTVLTTKHAGIAFYSTIALLASILEKPLMLYAVGVGPLHSEMGKIYTRGAVELADSVSVRDKASKQILHSLGIDSSTIRVNADPAFCIHPHLRDNGIRDKLDHEVPILGISLRNWDVGVLPDYWERQVAEAIDIYLEAHNGRAVFIPFQNRSEALLDDYKISERVQGYLRNSERTFILEEEYSPEEIAGIIGECDLLLGMRLHALIFAIQSGTPAVGIVYDPKVQHLLAQAGVGKYGIELGEINAQALAALLEDAHNNRDDIVKQIQVIRPSLERKARENVALVMKTMSQSALSKKILSQEAALLLKRTALSLSQTLVNRERANVDLQNALARTKEEVVQCDTVIGNLQSELSKIKDEVAQRDIFIDGLSSELEARKGELQALELRLSQSKEKAEDVHAQLQEIKKSRGWKILWGLWEIRSFFIPPGSWREKVLRKIWYGLRVHPLQFIKKVKRRLGKIFSPKMSNHAFAFDLYKRSRSRAYPPDLSSLHLSSQCGLVSIILPVYNGANLISEAIDSVLAQTYKNFELIIINDGSQDNTDEILDEYAKQDQRIHVIHQENRKLPQTLSRGFQEAQGEFLTWISHDNRLKPEFLEKMVACLKRHPTWDMIYANQDIIGEGGSPLRGSDWYEGYQRPPGSEHIYLPQNTAELNTWANNFIGGAFLYRDRVHWLIGNYSSLRYTREDYDYWMRVNALLTLKHADFKEPLYEYRFHADSLTYKDTELGITSNRKNLMVFDDFRRDFFLTPILWFIEENDSVEHLGKKITTLHSCINNAGHILAKVGQYKASNLPRLWMPSVYLKITSEPSAEPPPPMSLPPNIMAVLLCLSPKNNLPTSIDESWDICLALGSESKPPRLKNAKQGWLVSENIEAIFTAIDIRTRSHHLELIENEITQPKSTKLKISIIICTYKRQASLVETLQSVTCQSMHKSEYEILVVNNDPADTQIAPLIEELRAKEFSKHPNHLRLILCPILGLSHARNAGISEAEGEILLFLDDDATAKEDILEQYWEAYTEHPDAGVIGGHIHLNPPNPIPMLWREGWEAYWSQFITEHEAYTPVEHWWEYPWGANWSARREALLRAGGFRGGYGRRGSDFSGGEEIVAASLIKRLGYTVAVLPQAEVSHNIEASRFTLSHLKHTIRAGLFTQYQAQVELHIPVETSMGSNVKQINSSLIKLIHLFHPKTPDKKARLVETYYYISARWRLFRRQRADFFKKLQRPITRK